MHIGEYIKYQRESLGYTQKQLADYLSISKQAVCKWENCLALPDIMILPELADVLEIHPNDLTEIMWRGNREGKHTHFLYLNVTEKDGDGYTIKLFESYNFLPLADLFKEIQNGVNDSALQLLAGYYNYDNSRTFQIALLECEYEEIEDSDYNHFLIDTFDITSVVVNYCNQSKTEI